MMPDPSQLVLRFPRPDEPARPELLPHAGQDAARSWLEGGREGTQPWPLRRLALYGRPGAGKSHLARHWAERVDARILDRAPDTAWPRTALVVDSIDHVPDEPALLHLLNAAAENRQPVLLVSRLPPGRLPVRLPDLASRLRATTAVEIGQADEAFLAMLLARLLSERQLRLAAPLQAWLLTRLPRNAGALHDAVTRLDAAAMAACRPITRPMAAGILGFNDTPEG